MNLSLRLDVDSRMDGGAPSLEAGRSAGSLWGTVLAVGAALSVSSVFLLWLASSFLLGRNRAPRLAAVLGFLPHKLAEFKNLKR